MEPGDNPFERYGLDPREGVAAITQRLKELAEDAKDEAERERIRAAWEELTLHPARRLRAALFAHPETRPPLAGPPLMRRPTRGAGAPGGNGRLELEAKDLVPLGLELALDPPGSLVTPDVPPSLDDDPLLRDLG